MSESLANLSKGKENFVYSTDERIIGKINLNGTEKTLYQKTFIIPNQNATSFTFAHGISNITYATVVPDGSWVDAHGYSAELQALPYYFGATDWIFARIEGNNIAIRKGSASTWYVNNADLIFTFNYIKS